VVFSFLNGNNVVPTRRKGGKGGRKKERVEGDLKKTWDMLFSDIKRRSCVLETALKTKDPKGLGRG